MQPAQLSLLADQLPSPAPTVLAELPEEGVGEAISLLGTLIAQGLEGRSGHDDRDRGGR